MVLPFDLWPKRELTSGCYTRQTLSSTQSVVIYGNHLNIMPLTIFFGFEGCTIPSISSCTLTDNSNVNQSDGISLNG